jgi:menaquinone-9 beta-reductase
VEVAVSVPAGVEKDVIEATTDIAGAAELTWDVVVVGAGPAGALAAHQCAGRGLRVLLIDKAAFPRYKVCGCCINNRSRYALRQAGLEHLLDNAVPLRACHVASHGRLARIPLPPGYGSLSRERLDAALVQAAINAGAQFLPETKATLGPVRGEARVVMVEPTRTAKADGATPHGHPQPKGTFSCSPPSFEAGTGTEREVHASHASHNSHTSQSRGRAARDPFNGGRVARDPVVLHARIVVAADGLAGKFAQPEDRAEIVDQSSRIGIGVIAVSAPDYYQSGSTFMACGRHGYLGLQRLEDDRLDLAAAVDMPWMRQTGGPAAAADALLAEAGFPAIPDLRALDWKGTPPLTRRAAQCALPRVVILGDAAGYVEPFTGEGIAWAVSAAVAVAPIVARAVNRYDEQFERAWRQRHRALVTRRQWICKTMAAGLRHPVLVRTVVAMLSAMPVLARPFVWRINTNPHRQPAAEPGLRS